MRIMKVLDALGLWLRLRLQLEGQLMGGTARIVDCGIVQHADCVSMHRFTDHEHRLARDAAPYLDAVEAKATCSRIEGAS